MFRLIHVELHRAWLDPLWLLITWSGLAGVHITIYLLLLPSRKLRPFALTVGLTQLVGGIVRLPFVSLTERMRPSNFEFANPLEPTFSSTNSFPSGHTMGSMTLAVSLWLCLRGSDWEWLGKAAIGWAILVGISRIYVGVHYPTDVLGGAILGTLVAVLVTPWFARKFGLPGFSESTAPEEP
ncbi:MAG: phosphatase PAP2 family protein [Armatimonadetes bacterium]|nr:phosphatase PAP2 family protein [Armatimonadota bacterium]